MKCKKKKKKKRKRKKEFFGVRKNFNELKKTE